MNRQYNNSNTPYMQPQNNAPYPPYPAPVPPQKSSKFGIGIAVGVLIALASCMLIGALALFLYLRAPSRGKDHTYQEKIEWIQSYLDEDFLFDIDEKAFEDALAEGMLAGTGDIYARYYTKEEFEQLLEDVAGSYGGIGVRIIMNDDNEIEVYDVFSGSPADQAGMRVKDIIVEADGVRGFEDLDALVAIVRGEEGSTVDVVVRRDDREIPMTLKRAVVEEDTIYYEMMENDIGYILITGFSTVSVQQFNHALEDLQAQGMKGLLLDLRDNPGGDYDAVVAMADRILPEGIITSVVDNKGGRTSEWSDEEHKIDLPMVVLINENSASASELFTGAIKDYEMATLVGTTTYGKGIVQSIIRFPDGSGMKFTTEEYLTPNDNHINGIGVVPDIVVEIPEEAYEDGILTAEEDTQYQKAMEVLLEKMQEQDLLVQR